jgi:S-methylmethionine-dependent homocysteine/selenocysteine methylase
LIAASIGPYGAYLANGSEYHGDYGISDQELTDFHEPRIKLLDSSTADILACETIPSFQEAKVLSAILKNINKAAWISFSCKESSSCEVMVQEWMDSGADMIGGCCGVGPEQIKAMGKIIYQ